MKTKEEIEKLAFLKYPRVINDPYNPMEDDNSYERKIWIDGYTQCQENMNNKYTEEDVFVIAKKLWNDISNNETLTYNSFEEYFNNKIKK